MIKVKTIISFILLSLSMFSLGCENTLIRTSEKDISMLNDATGMVKANQEDLSEEVKKRYHNIGEALAARYVNKIAPEIKIIPEEIVEHFYNGLVHLYNSDLEEARMVTKDHELFIGNPMNSRDVIITVREDESWLDNWKSGKTKTDVAVIDMLIDEFKLGLIDYEELSSIGLVHVEMRSNSVINVFSAGKFFSSLKQIKDAKPRINIITGGRSMKALVFNDRIELDITVGSGDCPAGCIYLINHKFSISHDGEVELVN